MHCNKSRFFSSRSRPGYHFVSNLTSRTVTASWRAVPLDSLCKGNSCDAYIALCLLDRGQGRDARITAIKIQRYDTRCYTTNSPNTTICWELHHSLSKTQFTQHKVLFIRNFVVSPTFRRWSISYHLCVVRLPRSTNAAAPRISDWMLDVTPKTTENFLYVLINLKPK